MKQSTDAYIERLKAQLSATETALYKAKMSAQEVNTRKNLQIANQQLEIEALKKQLEPNMFWNYNDAETGYYEINDVIDEEYHNVWDMEVGHEIEIQQAVRLPNIKVRITKISDDDLEWEVVNESK